VKRTHEDGVAQPGLRSPAAQPGAVLTRVDTAGQSTASQYRGTVLAVQTRKGT
jgi:hypothetical protein